MCRLLGYVGPPVSLEMLLYHAPFGLERQAWAPRLQQHGTINADGWGVGWYDTSIQPEPARYRTAAPMWSDRAFRDMAALLSCCGVWLRVLMTGTHQRGKSGGSKRGTRRVRRPRGSLWGRGRRDARSFDAPRRAGMVTNQDSTVAGRQGEQAISVAIGMAGKATRR